MYILGISCDNLLFSKPTYNVVLCTNHNSCLYSDDNISRIKLQKIVNLKEIDALAMWSDAEFKFIENLTARKIIFIKDWYKTHFNCKYVEEILPHSVFNEYRALIGRCAFSCNNNPEYFFPPFNIIKNSRGEEKFELSRLYYQTMLLSKSIRELGLN